MFNIYVVDDDNEAPAVVDMFMAEGYAIVDDLYDADVVVFVGGEDINPALYSQRKHSTTHFNINRDADEISLYQEAVSLGIPMAGICRGGQLLNVLNGGKLWQDVDHHNSGYHKAYRVGDTTTPITVTSVHHQMMEPDPFSDVIILLTAGESTKLISMSELGSIANTAYARYPALEHQTDVEACFYPSTNCLCFQPHPEYNHKETKDVFFYFLNNYVLTKKED